MSNPASRPPNVIEHVWLAWAFGGDEPADLDRRLARVGAHYQEVMASQYHRGVADLEGAGLALYHHAAAGLRWPLWAQDGPLTAAWSSAPTGWRNLVDGTPSVETSVKTGERLASSHAAAAVLTPPFLLGFAHGGESLIEIVQDPLGLGRLYEMALPGGFAWSNRLGALPLFAGTAPRADEQAWRVLAAAGWFLGETTAIAGVRKLEGGARISIRRESGAWTVKRDRSRRRDELVTPREADRDAAVEAAASAALETVRDVGALWDAEIEVDLSGGRDSRISAAAAVAAAARASYQTVDADPGEFEAAGNLARLAGIESKHVRLDPEPDSVGAAMSGRLASLHHFHDGMANPQAGGRGAIVTRHQGYRGPVVSGHGGELGHGFYYRSPERLAELRGKGMGRMVRRLMQMARKDGGAAQPETMGAYREEVERALEAGKAAGLSGPPLLDWFYLSQRFAHRSGLGVRADRYSPCATGAFVRACFDLRPRERLSVEVHRAVVSRLAPVWAGVPFFEGPGTDARVRYQRVWERPANVEYLEPLISGGGSWESLYEADRVRELWKQARTEGGSAHHERLFLRIAWRASFDDHLAKLSGVATS